MIAIVGSGPAALMAADQISAAGQPVVIFEKRKSAGRKLLVAGSSGLNVTNNLTLERFISHYTGPRELWKHVIGSFPPDAWLRFIHELGISTFEGTSGRYFVEDMKASRLLQTWVQRLASRGVRFEFSQECTAFSLEGGRPRLMFADGATRDFNAVCFALGGGSWEPQENPLRWPAMFRAHRLAFDEFTPSNVGFRVNWPEKFLQEADGLPLKGIIMTSAKASREGDAMVTRYGIEGTPVYFAGTTGTVHLDLKPDLSLEQIVEKLRSVKENLSPIRRIKRQLKLSPAALAVVFHLTPPEILRDSSLVLISRRIKAFPLELLGPQPLSEAISSAGGLNLSELDDHFMLKRFPGFFSAGEMLSWDVPTGGFLLQACVAQGFLTGKGVLGWLQK